MRRGLQVSLLLVLGYAVLLGYFTWKTFFSYVQPDYRPLLAWEAPWVSSQAAESSNGYFRRSLHLTSRPVHAWLAVMAPDHFTLFVNGRAVESASYLSGLAHAVVDVTPFLASGPNVLAIYNEVGTFPERPRVVVQGEYVDASGQRTPIRSDASWRVASRDESLTAQGGTIAPTPWFAPGYDDGRWPHVVEGDAQEVGAGKPLEFPPSLVTERSRSEWLWTSNPRASEAYFRLVLNAPERPRDAWLRIAAKRHYRLLVNGHPLVSQEETIGSEASSQAILRFHNIGPFLRPGANVVAVQAGNDRADRGLLIDGFVEGRDGRPVWLTSGAWKAADTAVPGWEAIDFDDGRWERAVARPLGPSDEAALVKRLGRLSPPVSFWLGTVAIASLNVGAALLACLLLWAGSAKVTAALTGSPPRVVAGWLGLTFLLPSLVLGFVYLLGFEVRLSPAFPYQPIVIGASVALLLVLHAVLLGAALVRGRSVRERSGPDPAGGKTLARVPAVDFGFVLAAGLAIVGVILRFKDIGREPLHGDEAAALTWTLGIFERGYPFLMLDGRPKLVFTSELVYYVKALGVWLMGPTALGMRILDPVIAGFTVLLFYLVGKWLYDRRLGLLAAAVYTVLPSAIGMTHHGRYPSQLQFLALLTVGLLFRAVEDGGFRPRRYYLAVGAFVATYLTWEGSFALLPSLALGMLVLTRPAFGWLKNRHLWIGVAFVSVLAICQLAARLLNQLEWPYYGTGLNDVTPALTWLYPFHEPAYYIRKFFLLENHHVLSLLFVLGIPLWFGRAREARALAYLGATLILDLTIRTQFLEVGNWRYVYYLLPLLILAASMTLLVYLDRLAALCRSVQAPGTLLAGIRQATAMALVGGVLLFSTSLVVKLYNLPWSYSAQYTRLGARHNPTLAGAANYIRQHWLPGDVVVAVNPQVLAYDLGRVDYFFETTLRQSLLVGSDPALPIHRYTGVPGLMTEEQLNEVRARSSRVWFASYSLSWPNPEITPMLQKTAQMVYEDWHSAVFLFGPRLR